MNIYATLLVELLFFSLSILFLFRFRSKLGLAPLYILLGAMQYLQSFSGTIISFEILDKYTIHIGSVIIFSAVLFAILLIYIKEGVNRARTLIIGIIISNFLLSALFGITYLQESALGLIDNYPTKPALILDFRYFITGTVILFFDFILLVILYQFLISKISKLYFFLILFITLTSVLIFDSFAFNLIVKHNEPDFEASLIGHIIGKSFAAFAYSLILYIYLKYVDGESENVSFISNQNKDIFSIIRYRTQHLNPHADQNQVEIKLTSQIETTLNYISDGFVALDTNWCYTYVNIKAGEFLGRSPESLIGKHIWTEFPDSVGLPYYKTYYEAVETQKKQYFENYYEPVDKWFENRIYPSKEGLTIYFTDITEKRKADINNHMLLSLIETSDDFIGLATLEGKPIYLNAHGRKLVGLDEKGILPISISDFFPEKYRDSILNVHIPNIYENNKWDGEVQFKNFKTGDLIPIEVSGFLIRDSSTNKPIASGIVAKDITKRKQVENDLINSEQIFRRLSSNAPVAIFQADKDGSCNYVNEEWLKYSGLTFNEALGFGYVDAIHPEDKARVVNTWQKSISSGEKFVSDLRFLHKNGKTTWLSIKVVGLYDANNELNGYIGMALDISERNKAEEQIVNSKKYLDNIINNIGDPVFVKDDKSHIILVNDAFCSMFNESRANVLGKTLAEDIPPEELDIFLRIDKQVISTGIENVNEETLTIKGKGTRIISTKKTRFIDSSDNIFLIGVIRDITERKKAQIELEKHRNNLEELVEIRTYELEKEKIKAQSADLMKSAFLATMSHELRTPMNSIIGFTSILLKEFAGPLNEEQKKQLSMVKTSSQHLLGLINDILDISKIEAGKLNVTLSPFDYLKTLEKTIDFLLPQVLKKGLSIRSEISEMQIVLKSDERRVEQVLLNLLSNAMKFSTQGTIIVKVHILDNLLVTEVIDQGIGIEEKDLNKLFSPFIQLDGGLNRSHEGTGLGLAICKSLIEKLGGSIQVQSKTGEGSNFTFKLPLDTANNK
ncbi:PAS domain S-box protein [Xanthomarina sp.]|uniref:PAS domain S-box protein n=1 Tax=Xanthomarina sp. TaxID=1931211 RepID=UPI002C0C54F4|nr:PAS domain S-box protein [Xanthomarina sp.]HLV39343.1 PAS domain S-box protein [Xanthomarina sp.]